jgi:pyruvate/2-oxoglutarate dehydrogenase complex dihydrolipoamide acyltransferase (E2) component
MSQSNLIGNFEIRRFPDFRNPTIDTLIWGLRRHHIPVLLEVDVTVAREVMRSQTNKTGQRMSFTGWVVKCLAQAISEHKSIHALRQGQGRVVIFEEVDVTVIVERVVEQPEVAETLPMPYIVRNANEKTVAAITAEIRAAQKAAITIGEVQIGAARAAWVTKLSTLLPRFIRNWFFWQPLFRNPFRFKQLMGTVSVTSLGMKGQGGMSWGIPIGIHPLIVAVGAIAKRPGVVQEKIVIREYVGLTVLFDHDVTDGAPVARFIRRLQELMAHGYGLENTEAWIPE